MSRNLNAQTVLLTTVQASGADVVVGNGGELKITNTEPIEIRKVSKTSFLSTNGSNPQIHTITSTAAIAGSTTYSGSITQVIEGATYTWPFTYTTPATAPAAAVFYTAINAKIQEGIDGGQILGVVSGGSTNSVFTCTAAAPVAYVTLSNLSDSVANTIVITIAGSSVSNTASVPRVLTSGGATTAVDGEYYLMTFSGVTGAGAADLNGRTLVARKLAGGNTFTLYGTSNTGAVVTTSATITVLPVVTNDVADYLVGCDGYNPSSDYFGVEIQYETTPGLDAGLQVAQAIFVDATANSVANVDAFAYAVTAALNGTSTTAVLNTLSA
jgi:hypothetical protein